VVREGSPSSEEDMVLVCVGLLLLCCCCGCGGPQVVGWERRSAYHWSLAFFVSRLASRFFRHC
jgi:hypothetical protein